MDDGTFDRAVIGAAFGQAGLRGWREMSLVEAARDAGLDLVRLRGRFPGRVTLLARFGLLADQAALVGGGDGTARERLFDMLLNRFEFLQLHRAGVLALVQAVRTDPALALCLYGATLRSMRWLLEAADVPTSGILGRLRTHGLVALWLYALRAWESDESDDLSGTMAAVDRGLDRAMQAERSWPGRAPAPEPAPPPSPALEPDAPPVV